VRVRRVRTAPRVNSVLGQVGRVAQSNVNELARRDASRPATSRPVSRFGERTVRGLVRVIRKRDRRARAPRRSLVRSSVIARSSGEINPDGHSHSTRVRRLSAFETLRRLFRLGLPSGKSTNNDASSMIVHTAITLRICTISGFSHSRVLLESRGFASRGGGAGRRGGEREADSRQRSQYPPHGQRPLFPYNYSISSRRVRSHAETYRAGPMGENRW